MLVGAGRFGEGKKPLTGFNSADDGDGHVDNAEGEYGGKAKFLSAGDTEVPEKANREGHYCS